MRQAIKGEHSTEAKSAEYKIKLYVKLLMIRKMIFRSF